jgi:hypothetical protein
MFLAVIVLNALRKRRPRWRRTRAADKGYDSRV